MTRALFIVLAGSLTFGCSGADTVSPSQVTLVTIVPGTELLMLGTTATFSAFVARSDGSGATTIDATWATDNPAVVTVDARGLATATAAGVVTITASYQGTSTSRALRVVPSYAGNWSGAYRTTACSATDPFFCMFEHAVGATRGAVAVFLTQLADQVTGFAFLDGLTLSVSGTVAVTGELSLHGEIFSLAPPPKFVLARIENWTSSLDPATHMLVGRFTHLHADTTVAQGPLTSRVDGELLNMKPFGGP